MGLFGLGKKKEEQKPNPTVSQQNFQFQSAPELPEFPSLPEDEEESSSEFPKYEPTVADIKKEVSKGAEDNGNIPVRNQTFAGKKMVAATVGQSLDFTFSQPSSNFSAGQSQRSSSFNEEKPIFVRIDNYKDAMHTLEALKAKLHDAEEVLRALEEVKSQEEEKLETWKKDIHNIKEKLVSIDKNLFEV